MGFWTELYTIARTLYNVHMTILVHNLRSPNISSLVGPMTSKKSSKLYTTLEVDFGV
jgi:hypothetical protein